MDEEKKDMQDSSIEEVANEIEAEETEISEEQKKDNKIKNLISAVILLAGLFVGSLFVDAFQMIQGGGFSQHALKNADVFATGGKTWVAYTEPLVKMRVVSDDSCEACKPDEVLVGLKQALPTMQNEKIDVNSPEGKKLVAEFDLKTIPAFIFSKEIEKTELFAKAEPFMNKQNDGYAIKSAEAGFPVGKFIVAPSVNDKDIVLGAKDAEIKVVYFGNFQSPTDKKAYTDIFSAMLKDYGDKIALVYKNNASAAATQSAPAALAAACANDQGKFVAYADKLFANQDAWSKAKDALPALKVYAQQAGLDAGDFNKCLDEKKYQDQITTATKDAQAFGVEATPAIFVGTDMQKATAKYDDVKKALDAQLN